MLHITGRLAYHTSMQEHTHTRTAKTKHNCRLAQAIHTPNTCTLNTGSLTDAREAGVSCVYSPSNAENELHLCTMQSSTYICMYLQKTGKLHQSPAPLHPVQTAHFQSTELAACHHRPDSIVAKRVHNRQMYMHTHILYICIEGSNDVRANTVWM